MFLIAKVVLVRYMMKRVGQTWTILQVMTRICSQIGRKLASMSSRGQMGVCEVYIITQKTWVVHNPWRRRQQETSLAILICTVCKQSTGSSFHLSI
jgi:hypothetical protein